MTDLQISLIVIGAVIVIGVLAYNKWREYRAHKKVERAFSDVHEDVLMRSYETEDDDIRREPVFSYDSITGVKLGDPVREMDDLLVNDDNKDKSSHDTVSDVEYTEISESDSAFDDVEKLLHDDIASKRVETGGERASAERKTLTQHLPVDDLIDYPIILNLEEPVRGEKILPLIQTLRYTGNKSVHYIGLAQNEIIEEKSWQPITHGGIYHQLKAGVQLANRTGALNEIEYSELIARLRQLSDGIGAEPEVPDMNKVLKSARSLFQFVADHDARLGINVRSNGAPWLIKTLVALLERQKFELRPDGFFVLYDTDGSVLFSLMINQTHDAETASRVTLLLDVPCVAQEKNAFGIMVQCAKSLCQRLDGCMVDDDDKMLSDPMINDVAIQVNVFYEEMKSASIPGGSIRALRLFN